MVDAEKPVRQTNRGIAAKGMAGLGLGAGLGARAVAGVASFPTGHPDFRIETGSGLFQAYIERVFQVGAAIYLGAAATASAATTEDFTKNVAEGVGKTGPAHAAGGIVGNEIGRASGRARVSKYV